MKRIVLVVLALAGSLVSIPARATAPIRVMILDGESGGTYHNWRVTTQVIKQELDEVGMFVIDIVTAPRSGNEFESFRPNWSKYKVIVFNYDAPDIRWPTELKASFEAYMRNGGGMVAVHAADNAFPGWQAYNQMIGVGGWRDRDEKAGPHWYYSSGKLVSDDSPGKAGHHGIRRPYKMTSRAFNHPIMRGLPKTWMHQGDELYDSLRGPGTKMTVLATAYSDPANGGTGFDEPLLMVSSFGKERIFHTAVGHDALAMSSVDAVVTLQRGAEWAATGKVTQKLPVTFPNEKTISYRADLAALDPNYPKGLNPLDIPNQPAPAKKPGN